MLARGLKSLLLCLLLWFPAAAPAQPIGRVAEIQQTAQVQSQNVISNLAEGREVLNGDIVQTNATGEVQIVFVDDTKMVVGKNSQLALTDALFKTDGKAKKFATKALSGTFRFISGDSRRQVYNIGTPIATMGIRGTEFDYSVGPDRRTDLLVFRGQVRFCNRDGVCMTVPGGCQAVSIDRFGQFGQPTSPEEKSDLLSTRFPLVGAQEDFRSDFRVATDGCGGVNIIRLPRENERSGSDRSSGGDSGGNPAE